MSLAPSTITGKEADTTQNANGQPHPKDIRSKFASEIETAIRFLSAIFDPKDNVLIRPIQSWTDDDGNKKTKIDYKGEQYICVGSSSLAFRLARAFERSEQHGTNVFLGVCPRFGSDGYNLKWQVRIARCLWGDIDGKTVGQALDQCENANLPKPSIVVKSGNGVHLYWLLNEPYLIDDVGDPPKVLKEWRDIGESRKPIHYFMEGDDRVYLDDPSTGKRRPGMAPELSAKAKRFESIIKGLYSAFGVKRGKVGADSVHDLTRLLRLPGSMNRKDQCNGVKPKPCELVECEPERRYSVGEFEHLAELSDDAKREKQVAAIPLPTVRKMTATREDKLNEKVAACAIETEDRSALDFHLCAFAIEKGYAPDEVWARCANVGKFADRGREYFDLTWEKAANVTREDAFARIAGGEPSNKRKPKRNAPAKVSDDDPTPILGDPVRIDEETDKICACEPCTDLGNANRFLHRNSGNIRHCHPWKKDMIWDGCRWRLDDIGNTRRRAQVTVRRIQSEAIVMDQKHPDPELEEWATYSQNSKVIDPMLKEMRAMPGVPILPDDMDKHPLLLNCSNGTLDLETCELRPHRREDNLTKLCRTPYNPSAKAPTWERVLRAIFDGDDEIVEFMQRWFGYSLTGQTNEQKFLVWHGTGANGKSTILNAIFKSVIGDDYAGTAAQSLLFDSTGNNHPTERADAFGRRLLSCVEIEDGARLNEAVIKRVTGGDPMKARRMREDPWEFMPTFKLIICANHKPKIHGTDHSIWRRVLFIPFEVTFWDPTKKESGPEHLRQDKGLEKQLEAEREGILAWALEGCRMWQKDGLIIPDSIRAATAEYREDQDILTRFLEEECVLLREAKAKSGKIFERLNLWLERSGEKRVFTNKAMSERLAAMGFKSRKSNGCMWFDGIGLRDHSEEENDEQSTY